MNADTSAIVAPVAHAVGLPNRLVRLFAGLVLFGVSLALMVRADLGLGPWDVLHQGLARLLHIQIGTMTILVGALVLLAWVPLRQRPGVGTVANVVVVGLSVDAALAVLPVVDELVVRATLFAVGMALNAVATGLYVGSSLGPGPRDGLMTGLAARGIPIRVARTAIEVSVLVLGFLAGGTVGVGTVVFALGIGPLVQWFLPRLTVNGGPR